MARSSSQRIDDNSVTTHTINLGAAFGHLEGPQTAHKLTTEQWEALDDDQKEIVVQDNLAALRGWSAGQGRGSR
jgi:hypothetical protein